MSQIQDADGLFTRSRVIPKPFPIIRHITGGTNRPLISSGHPSRDTIPMNFLKTLLAGVAGTACMTLYSYVRSRNEDEQYREPLLLHRLLGNSNLPDTEEISRPMKQLDGWLVHFGTGMIFSAVYNRLWKNREEDPSLPEGAAIGGVSGLAGVIIWVLAFNLHPDPPDIDRKAFYKHLIAAHVIFGIMASLGYRQPESEEMKQLMEKSGGEVRTWDPRQW